MRRATAWTWVAAAPVLAACSSGCGKERAPGGSPSATLASSGSASSVTSVGPSASGTAALPDARPTCKPGMALVPGGRFTMGSDAGESDQKPARSVGVEAFCLDVTEVTTDAYAACAAAGGCTPAGARIVAPSANLTPAEEAFFSKSCNAGKAGREKHPVNCVDWHQAKAYCEAQGKRLPSEEEWEYAAAGGDEQRPFPWGLTPPGPTLLNACGTECVAYLAAIGMSSTAMYAADDGHATTSPVGSYPAGKARWGQLDLAGNVWEWTASGYSRSYGEPREDEFRVNRGGSWRDVAPSYVRPPFRGWIVPTDRYVILGFRCAGSPLP